MAALAEHPMLSASDPMSISEENHVYDPDVDVFLNLDQFTSTAAESAQAKVAVSPLAPVKNSEFLTADGRSASFASTGKSPIAFQGPSHQYDEHRQQTGLPPGALAQAIAFDHAKSIGYGTGPQRFVTGVQTFDGQRQCDNAPINFSATPSANPLEMDLNSEKSIPLNQDSKGQFVDPGALGGSEAVHVGPPMQVGRIYPGMHQQRAAMAKAAQQQKYQQQLRCQQEMQQCCMEEHPPQPTLPHGPPMQHPDPVIEERIKRLLQQMKENIVISREEATPASLLPQMAKARKDEQDMDEDERLLASEEGKKLSSKERRQLRNKVSARAFRSRRKEYISQLESEVATRTTEAHELRLQNRALKEENARLTDLARMLLASPHFGSFLDDLSVNCPSEQRSQPRQHLQQQPQRLPPPKTLHLSSEACQLSMPTSIPSEANGDLGHVEFQVPQNPQVGMMMVPNQAINTSAMSVDNPGWNSGINLDFSNAPVFAVLDVPEPFTLESDILSDKASNLPSAFISEAKEECPSLDRPPMAPGLVEEPGCHMPVSSADVDLDLSDLAFPLFFDSPATGDSADDMIDDCLFTAAKEDGMTVRLVGSASHDLDSAVRSRFDSLCHSIEAAFQRVSLVTSHLL